MGGSARLLVHNRPSGWQLASLPHLPALLAVDNKDDLISGNRKKNALLAVDNKDDLISGNRKKNALLAVDNKDDLISGNRKKITMRLKARYLYKYYIFRITMFFLGVARRKAIL